MRRFALDFATSFWFIVAVPLIFGQGPTPAAPKHKNPCDYLSVQAASALLGATAKPGHDMGTACVFSHSAEQDVTVGVIDAPGKNAGKAFQSAIAQQVGKTVEPLSGIGEAATFLGSSSESDLHVLAHGKILSLGVRNAKSKALKPAMMRLAREIVPRLQ